MKEKLFLLLRYAICEQTELAQDIKQDLPQIYKLAKKHDMAQTVAYACEKLGISHPVLEKEKALSLFRTEKISYTAENAGNVLEEARIPHIFLKGYYLRSMYPEAWLRPSCDVDIYVGEKNAEAAAQALEKAGYVRGRRHIYDIMFTSPNGSTVELHFLLTDGDGHKKTARVLSDVWKYTVAETEYRYRMNEEMFYFYHIAHMSKHVRTGGCGIRPFADMWLLCREQKNREKTDVLLEKGGLADFERIARRLAFVWFSGEKGDSDTDALEEYILSGAVYGNKHNAAAGQGSKIKYLFTRIFMPYSQLKYKYPALNGKPYLYGFYIVRRWLNLLKGKRAKHSMDEFRATCTVSTPESTKYSQLFKNLKL